MGLFDDLFGGIKAAFDIASNTPENTAEPKVDESIPWDTMTWDPMAQQFDISGYIQPEVSAPEIKKASDKEQRGKFVPTASTVDFSAEMEGADPLTKIWLQQMEDEQNANTGITSALRSGIGLADPYSSISLGGRNYDLNKNDQGEWTLDPAQKDALEKAGYHVNANNDFYNRLNFGTNEATGKYNWQPDGVVSFNGEIIQDPSEFDKALYRWMMENEDRLAKANGGTSIGDDLYSFRSSSNFDDEWNMMMHDLNAMTDEEGNRYGFYDSVLYDPRFMTDGEFDFSKFLDYASQMNVADMLAGRLSDEQNDWMSSGGYGGNIGIAKYLSSFGDSIPIGINPNISDFLDNYISGNLGTFAASDDSENAKTARAYDKASKNGLVTSNDQGEWFLNLDSNEGFDYILNSLIEDTYTNPTLPDSYGYSNPSAGTMNQIAQRLGISDRYDTLPDDYEGEMPYFGEAQAYRNPWKSKTLDDYLRFTMGERFNPAANAAVNNPKLNRRQY